MVSSTAEPRILSWNFDSGIASVDLTPVAVNDVVVAVVVQVKVSPVLSAREAARLWSAGPKNNTRARRPSCHRRIVPPWPV